MPCRSQRRCALRTQPHWVTDAHRQVALGSQPTARAVPAPRIGCRGVEPPTEISGGSASTTISSAAAMTDSLPTLSVARTASW